jgi:hypothetical protein
VAAGAATSDDGVVHESETAPLDEEGAAGGAAGVLVAMRRGIADVDVLEPRPPAEAKERLAARLLAELEATGDPRVLGGAERLEAYPYYGGSPTKPVAPLQPK